MPEKFIACLRNLSCLPLWLVWAASLREKKNTRPPAGSRSDGRVNGSGVIAGTTPLMKAYAGTGGSQSPMPPLAEKNMTADSGSTALRDAAVRLATIRPAQEIARV